MNKAINRITRRDLIKGLAGLPVLGLFGFLTHRKQKVHKTVSGNNLFDIVLPQHHFSGKGGASDRIHIGIIGFGGRGEYLSRSLGFAHPDWIDSRRKAAERNPQNTNLSDFLAQEDLNVEIVAVCDLFTLRRERSAVISKSEEGPGARKVKPSGAKIYTHYTDLLNDPVVDAVIIATQDHWHHRICMDAIRAGKHVYLEKCMAITVDQARDIRNAVRSSNISFQLGHQNHQIDSHLIASEIIRHEKIGHLSLIQGSSDRYRKGTYRGHPDASPETIDWEQYQEPLGTKYPFDPHRFFGWNNYFDYGLGWFGGLLSHEFAAINQISAVGIPAALTTTGGIYLWKENFQVPNVFGVNMDYPDKDLVVTYSLNFGNSHVRRRLFVGTEGIMEASNVVNVYPEPGGEMYGGMISSGKLDPDKPIYSWPEELLVDAVTSATEMFYMKKGVYYTYQNGKWVDSSHLHIRDWLNGIRYDTVPKCNADLGFEEAVVCIMATRSFLENRTVYWDKEKEEII